MAWLAQEVQLKITGTVIFSGTPDREETAFRPFNTNLKFIEWIQLRGSESSYASCVCTGFPPPAAPPFASTAHAAAFSNSRL